MLFWRFAVSMDKTSLIIFLSVASRPRLLSKFRTGLNMEKAKGPNAELLRELALEDQKLMAMLATNGKSKPDKSQ